MLVAMALSPQGSRMSEPELTPEQKATHESNKVVRQALAFAHFKLQHVPHILEEDKDFELAVQVLHALCLDLQKKIEAVEPPPPEAPKEKSRPPYVIDVPARPIESSGH